MQTLNSSKTWYEARVSVQYIFFLHTIYKCYHASFSKTITEILWATVYCLTNFVRIYLSFSLSEPRQSHTTIAVVDRHSDGTYILKALKQKLFVDGLCFLLQEIYGIENKNNDNNKVCSYCNTDDIPKIIVCMWFGYY